MMKYFTVVAVLATASAAPAAPAQGYVKVNAPMEEGNPQQIYPDIDITTGLMNRPIISNASGFEPLCKISKITVETDVVPGLLNASYMEVSNLYDVYGSVKDLKTVYTVGQYFSDIDGRSTELTMNTPGGDFGEFVLGLQAYEAALGGYTLTLLNIQNAMEEFIRELNPERRFYYMTDEDALEKLRLGAVKCTNINVINPAESRKPAILEALGKPEYQGCFHIKNMLANPASYNIRKGLVADAIKALHINLWNESSATKEKVIYTELKGTPVVKAFVNIRPPAHCLYAGLSTYTVPCSGGQYLSNHPEPVMEFRAMIANFLAKYGPEWHPMIVTKYPGQKTPAPPIPLRPEDFDPTELGKTVLRTMLENAPNSLANTVTPQLRGAPAYTVNMS